MSKRIPRDMLERIRRHARGAYNALVGTDPEYRDSHRSHAARVALEDAEQRFGLQESALTFGVEGFTEFGGCTYLNTGDAYTPTVYFRNGLFHIGCWGTIVETHS